MITSPQRKQGWVSILSTILLWLAAHASAHAQPFITVQNSQVVTPQFQPAVRTVEPKLAPGTLAVPPVPGRPVTRTVQMQGPAGEQAADIFVRTELPGPQRLFMVRQSETQFYERLRQEVKKQAGASPAIFPEETPISKEWYTKPPYPRVDPIDKRPFPHMTEVVEPCFVCHRRLLFEQPNFERLGYNFGVLQPLMHLGTFSYDMAALPYHYWSDLRNRGECSVGKCLPGDQAPFTVPIERFSVTGIIGEMGAVIGGVYLFPH